MVNEKIDQDEQERRALQEYIFNLEAPNLELEQRFSLKDCRKPDGEEQEIKKQNKPGWLVGKTA